MTRARTHFRCETCGATAPRWQGRCPGCDTWNSLVEERDVEGRRARPRPLAGSGVPGGPGPGEPAVPVTELIAECSEVRPTGLAELDRVLHGGLVPGSVTLLAGEPGVGKSTLLVQLAASFATRRGPALYLSGEESAAQVRRRAERLGALHPTLWLAAVSTIDEVRAHLEAVRPTLLVVDSIQTLHDPELVSAPGSVSQVRECSAALAALAKRTGTAVVLAGHVTKEGGLAGPRVLEHLVDTVLSFEGDRDHGLRLLHARKHRFGATAELGVFVMGDAGLEPVADPSALFLADRDRALAGTVVVPTVEGRRPLLVELQVLTDTSVLPSPRRSAHGLDSGRLAMLLAVLARRGGLSMLAGADVYAMAVGGARVSEPGADLALAIALASAVADRPVAGDLVAVGEIGLVGEVRQVGHCELRLREAARLGFRRAIVPHRYDGPDAGLQLTGVRDITDVLALVDGSPAAPTPTAMARGLTHPPRAGAVRPRR